MRLRCLGGGSVEAGRKAGLLMAHHILFHFQELFIAYHADRVCEHLIAGSCQCFELFSAPPTPQLSNHKQSGCGPISNTANHKREIVSMRPLKSKVVCQTRKAMEEKKRTFNTLS